MGESLLGIIFLILTFFFLKHKIDINYSHNNISHEPSTKVENTTSSPKNIDIHDQIKVIHTLRKFYPRDFEEFVALLFELNEYEITKRPTYKGKKAKRDGGVDIEATKDGVDYFIQVKKLFTHEVSVKIIREFNGIMANKTGKGLIITTSIFSKDSLDEKGNLELIDYRALLSLILSLPEEKLEIVQNFINDNAHIDNNFGKKPITCMHCGAPMVKRYWRGRMFYGCMNYYTTHCANQSDFLIS